MSSPHTVQFDLFKAIPFNRMTDPGDGRYIYADRQLGFLPLVSLTAETRTLAAPERPGVLLLVEGYIVAGTITFTVTGTYDGTNSAISVTAAAQWFLLLSVVTTAGASTGAEDTCQWRLIASSAFLPMSAASVSASSVLASAITATNLRVGTGSMVLGTAVQVSGGSAASVAVAINSPAQQLISVGTASLNYFKLPAPSIGLQANIVNLGSTIGLIGAAGESIYSATSVALATANATGSAINLVADGTNWWKKSI